MWLQSNEFGMGRERVSPPPQAPDALRAFGAEVRLARERMSLTMEDLAARAGVSTRTVSQIERGAAAVSAGNLFTVAVAAGFYCSVRPEPSRRAFSRSRGRGRRTRALCASVGRVPRR